MTAWAEIRVAFYRFAISITFLFVFSLIFQMIESPVPPAKTRPEDVHQQKQFPTTLKRDLILKYNLSISEENFTKLINEVKTVVEEIKASKVNWTFSMSFHYVSTLITTIGYGDHTPRTQTGRLVTVFCGLLGIPVMMLTLKSIGELINHAILYFIVRVEKRCFRRKDVKLKEVKVAAVTFILMWALILIGALWEQVSNNWTIIEGVYCYFVTYSTIGFGDYIPTEDFFSGDSLSEGERSGWQYLISVFYLYVGLGLASSVIQSLATVFEAKKLNNVWKRALSRSKRTKLRQQRTFSFNNDGFEDTLRMAMCSLAVAAENAIEADGIKPVDLDSNNSNNNDAAFDEADNDVIVVNKTHIIHATVNGCIGSRKSSLKIDDKNNYDDVRVSNGVASALE